MVIQSCKFSALGRWTFSFVIWDLRTGSFVVCETSLHYLLLKEVSLRLCGGYMSEDC